jgi:glyoxylate reductase
LETFLKPKVIVSWIPPDGDALSRISAVSNPVVWGGGEQMDEGFLRREAATAVGIYSMLTDQIDADLLESAPELRVVSNMAVGVDNIDLAACAAAGVSVGHTPDVLTETTADTAFMLVLASSRRMLEGVDMVRGGRWGTWVGDAMLGLDVSGTTIGIVGMGRIGAAIATRATGFSMDILYWSRSPKPDVEASTGAKRVSLEELLTHADHVVLAVPLSSETRHLIGPHELSQMKASANLVNISRGPVIDTGALVDALESQEIRCAGLDVTDPEPIPADHPLVSLANCTIVPHIGSATLRTRNAMADLAVDNLIAGVLGEPLPNPVV